MGAGKSFGTKLEKIYGSEEHQEPLAGAGLTECPDSVTATKAGIPEHLMPTDSRVRGHDGKVETPRLSPASGEEGAKSGRTPDRETGPPAIDLSGWCEYLFVSGLSSAEAARVGERDEED